MSHVLIGHAVPTDVARVVSTRAVDHHVSAVLQKLGVRTRREAAAQLDSLGPVGATGSRERP